MQRYDTIIVGGGPAGATSAWKLRRAGMKVAVVDQAVFPRDKVCAGWITPSVLKSLEIEPRDYSRGRMLQKVGGFRVGLMGTVGKNTAGKKNGAADIKYPGTISYGIRRSEFDDYLLRRSGAHVFTGINVHSLKRDGWDWVINDDFSAPMLIGAGGHACPVARVLGAQPNDETAVVAKEIEFLLPEYARATCKVHSEQPELYFCHDLAGYGWCFRKGDYLNVGLGREERWELAKHVEGFLSFLQSERGVPFPPKHLNGHAYLLYGKGRRTRVAQGALLVGDAAGLAYPYSGEGIRPAVESGLLAAQTIIEAEGDYSHERLEPYLERLRRHFGNHSSLKTTVSSAIPSWARVSLGRSVFSSPGLVRRMILDNGFLHPSPNAVY
jgi:geranylgeranyl reductase family protein